MKSIYIIFAFVFSALYSNAQADQLIKVLVNVDQLNYLTTNMPALEAAVSTLEDAYKRSDDSTIGATKGDILKIVTQSPTILSNIASMAQATIENPNAAAERQGIDYEQYAAKMTADGKFEEIELLPEEIEALSYLVAKMKERKLRLKESKYAIHKSQSDKGSEKNVASLAQLTDDMAEAIEIIKIGQHR